MAVEHGFPRAVVALQVALRGVTEPVDVVVVPRRCSVTRRPHTQADTADIEIDGTQVPFDPRTIDSIVATVHMGNARSAFDQTWKTAATRRFVGYADTFEGDQEDDDTIIIKARDLSSPLRDEKTVSLAAIPKYADTLGSAIQRVLDNTPGVPALEVVLVDGDTPLAPLVHERGRGGHIHLENDMTAWAVIEYVAGLAARIVSLDGDRILVRLARNAYDHHAVARATIEFGSAEANLTRLHTNKKFIRNRKGVRCVAWDPTQRRVIEADFPPDSALPPRTRPNPTAATSRRRRAPPQPPERDVYPVQGVPNKDGLMRVAESIWLERSRQEMTVGADTPYYTEAFLGMANGDRLRLQLNRALVARLNQTQSKAAQIAFVRQRLQVEQRAAELLVASATEPGADLFYVHEAVLHWNPEGDIGVKAELINLIAVESPTNG